MFIVYINPIGAGAPEKFKFYHETVAREVYETACCPLLSIDVYLIWHGPNPMFPDRQMQTIEAQWHRRDTYNAQSPS